MKNRHIVWCLYALLSRNIPYTVSVCCRCHVKMHPSNDPLALSDKGSKVYTDLALVIRACGIYEVRDNKCCFANAPSRFMQDKELVASIPWYISFVKWDLCALLKGIKYDANHEMIISIYGKTVKIMLLMYLEWIAYWLHVCVLWNTMST